MFEDVLAIEDLSFWRNVAILVLVGVPLFLVFTHVALNELWDWWRSRRET